MDNPSGQSVQLSIPAHPRMLRFARMTAATMAVDLAFSLEDVEDIRVAVDELAAAAIDGVNDSTMLHLQFEIRGEDLIVDGEVEGGGTPPELHPVAQELINMVVDKHELSERDGKHVFRLVKRRSVEA